MKKQDRFAACLSLLLCFGSTACFRGSIASAVASPPPNIVLVMIDDLGWSDIGCYGNDFVETPNIDQLASEGVRFTHFYASGAVCSPTRCALQSGQNQARIGITAHIPGHWRPFETVQTPMIPRAMPLDTVTIAENLKTVGYQTGYIGKWHLGNQREHQPDQQGYDESIVINGPHLPGRYGGSGQRGSGHRKAATQARSIPHRF